MNDGYRSHHRRPGTGRPGPMRGDGSQARQLTGQQGPRSRQDRLDDIAAIAARAGLGEAALKNRVSYTEIVKADDASGVPGSLIEFSWKICSGLTHGDSWAAWSASP